MHVCNGPETPQVYNSQLASERRAAVKETAATQLLILNFHSGILLSDWQKLQSLEGENWPFLEATAAVCHRLFFFFAFSPASHYCYRLVAVYHIGAISCLGILVSQFSVLFSTPLYTQNLDATYKSITFVSLSRPQDAASRFLTIGFRTLGIEHEELMTMRFTASS